MLLGVPDLFCAPITHLAKNGVDHYTKVLSELKKKKMNTTDPEPLRDQPSPDTTWGSIDDEDIVEADSVQLQQQQQQQQQQLLLQQEQKEQHQDQLKKQHQQHQQQEKKKQITKAKKNGLHLTRH
jgi:hypothetical protein